MFTVQTSIKFLNRLFKNGQKYRVYMPILWVLFFDQWTSIHLACGQLSDFERFLPNQAIHLKKEHVLMYPVKDLRPLFTSNPRDLKTYRTKSITFLNSDIS